MQQPVINPSPKQRFMQSTVRISDHRNLVSSEPFEKAADAAMLQYIGMIATATNANEAAATGLKLQGALEFLQTFKLLAETMRVPTVVPKDNLNPNA